ncbi:MAG: hypothetical protein ACK2UW_19835 [Anaerolineales bacterium]|jgi:hypothetical protein
MDWNQQFEENMKAWTETQQKAWDSYFETMEGLGKSQSQRAWESTLSMGEKMLKDMLITQNQWLASWVAGLSQMSGVPAPAVDSARQFQEMGAQWNKTQGELIGNWFTMLKKFAPAGPSSAWTDIPQNMYKVWQDSTQSIIDAQMKWMQAWMGQTQKTKDE